jgi:hypothetical protein
MTRDLRDDTYVTFEPELDDDQSLSNQPHNDPDD